MAKKKRPAHWYPEGPVVYRASVSLLGEGRSSYHVFELLKSKADAEPDAGYLDDERLIYKVERVGEFATREQAVAACEAHPAIIARNSAMRPLD